jgi:hypothetical protein
MGFDFDSFAGAFRTLSEAVDKTAMLVGIPRETLTRALHRRAKTRKDRWEERLWKAARTEKELSEWIYKRARDFNIGDESEILELSKTIAYRIRRNLIEIAKTIPASRGGKRPILDSMEKWRVRSEVRKLQEKGIPKENAYARVAKSMTESGRRVSTHTVRRTCDERERERSRQASRKPRNETGLALIDLD